MFASIRGFVICVIALSLPPDKVSAHIIKTRSIDINNAHGLALESRLSKNIEPTSYHLELEPDIEDGDYKGHVRIEVNWNEQADEVTLHCAPEVTITEWEVKYKTADTAELQTVQVEDLSVDPKKPQVTLTLQKPIPKSAVGYLDFTFNGKLETAITEGFFKTVYSEQDHERIVVATQFRPNNARRMFPCFDEPAFKATFELSVVRPRNMVALSNTPVAKTEDIEGEPNAVRDLFEKTPKISTFSLGLVIADLSPLGELTQYENAHGTHLAIQVWGRPEYLEALKGAEEKITKILTEMTNYIALPQPLIKKLDVVALPNYQGAKPADNLGLIVFRESDLGYKGYIPLIQELWYQWLGNIATPAWWNDAHVNKALVGFLTSEIAAKLNHDSDKEGDWPITSLYSLYYEYSKRYPHSRITGMKQETTCTKIELLFRMFNYTIGSDTFKRGLSHFIKERSFKTFTSDDLWNSFNNATQADGKLPKDVDIKTIATSWIEKDRLPLIKAERNYESNSVTFTQKVYLRERPHDVPDANRLTWWVPLVIVRGDKPDFQKTTPVAWMNNRKEMKLADMPKKSQFIIVNPEEIAPYPVLYDEENWVLLSNFLQSEKRTTIPGLTRAKILHDAWNLAYAGELSFATAFNMTLFLNKERNHIVWEPIFSMIDHVGRHISKEVHKKFQIYVQALLSPLYEELSKDIKEDEPYGRKHLRATAKSTLCSAGYKPCIKEAQEAYAKWLRAEKPDDGNPISDLYLCPVFKYGSKEEWEFGLQRVINLPASRQRSERTFLLKSLAGCADEKKIIRLLNLLILEDKGNFTETDLHLVLNMLTGSYQGFNTLFVYLAKNWDVLKEKLQSKTNLWDNLISTATSKFMTQADLEQVSSLYKAHRGEFGSAEHIIEKSMKNIREEAKWSTENVPVIEKWLDHYLASRKGS